MNKKEFMNEMNDMVKVVRAEFNLRQDRMASIMGISKKTLIEIEKGRISIDWSTAIVFATLFSESKILQNQYGGEMSDMIKAIAFGEDEETVFPKLVKTMGGKIWWRILEEDEHYKIQQNIISNHYRILDSDNRRIISSYNYIVIKKFFDKLIEE